MAPSARPAASAANGERSSANSSGEPRTSAGSARLEKPYECESGAAARQRSSAVSPIDAASWASSAASAAAETAMPRGSPVEPEESLIAPVVAASSVSRSGARREKTQEASDSGQPEGDQRKAATPSRSSAARWSGVGSAESQSTGTRPSRRSAR